MGILLISARLPARGQLYLGKSLTDLRPQESGVQLVFGYDTVHAKEVMLNLPRTPFLSLPTLRQAIPNRTIGMAKCVKFDLPTKFFPAGSFELGKSLTKAYAFYDDAWWITRLNQSAGQLPANAFMPVNTSEHIPIGIHFNDGPVRCDKPGVNCRGFLEVYYSTVNDEDFFESLRPSTYEPLGTLTPDKDSTGKLPRLHAAVMEATKKLFQKKNATQPQEPPSLLVVGVWDRTGSGYTAPTKVYYSTDASNPGGPDPLEKACGVAGLTEKEYRDSLMFPIPNRTDISLANNDWVAQTTETMFGDWAEESLLQAERALRVKGMDRPTWLDQAFGGNSRLENSGFCWFRDSRF
ncbi:HERC2 [Symbiodinium natans]|uniref:HERC2 protein n=1 Tax=Symbiodinium natans TaxID=878477 RepID=A0A812Q887_9DINO|nr:HERC2 [Symbiodinium natans]